MNNCSEWIIFILGISVSSIALVVIHFKEKIADLRGKSTLIEFTQGSNNCLKCGGKLTGEENFCAGCGIKILWFVRKNS